MYLISVISEQNSFHGSLILELLLLFLTFAAGFLVVVVGFGLLAEVADRRSKFQSTVLFSSSLRMPSKDSTIYILEGFTHAAFWCPPTRTMDDKVCSEVALVQPPEIATFTGDVKPKGEQGALGGLTAVQTQMSFVWFCNLVGFACHLQTQIQCSYLVKYLERVR